MTVLTKASALALLLIGFCSVVRGATPLDNGKVQKTLTELSSNTSIEVEDVPLLDFRSVPGTREPQRDGLISYLEDYHGLKFMLGPGVAKRPITYTATGIPLKKALSAILVKCDCDYSIMPDGTILIFQVNSPEKVPAKETTPSPKSVNSTN
jgi:hypothetical protein